MKVDRITIKLARVAETSSIEVFGKNATLAKSRKIDAQK